MRGNKNRITEKSIEFISTENKYPHLTCSKRIKEKNLAVSLKLKEYLFPDHNTVNMAVLLCSVFALLYVCNVQCLSKTCEFKGRNYTKCDLIFWSAWTICKGGHGWEPTECAIGFEKRQKKICCPRITLNETIDETFRHCKAYCYMTDDDFEEVRRLPTTCTTGTLARNKVAV